MGTSMGGCVALNYAAQAPAEIKDKITGIVSVEGAGDLGQLYNMTKSPAVQVGLIGAFGGTPLQLPEIYAKKSLFANMASLPAHIKVAVVSARKDDIVPKDLQKDLVHKLEEKNIPAKLIEIDGGHRVPAAPVYQEALDFVL